jgi:2-oxoglutarate ferredoxin oxidoreductase subunit gamma
MRKEIRIAGFGGQGVALAGYILGKALALHQGLEAVMTQSYGPEARGGASSANIVVSDREIAYPFVQAPDILVAFSQEAYTKFLPTTKEESIVLVDEELVKQQAGRQHFAIPATSLAEGLGRRIVANVVMLGFLTAATGLAKREALEETIRTSVKKKTIPLNLRAFSTGYEYAIDKEVIP